MITIHEFGHYTFGKIFKFKINEFSIGFGKALYSKKKKNGEVFSIRMLPLGGYCAFAGEDDETENAGDFNTKKPWQRIIVLLGGVLFNFLSAFIFSLILLWAFGYDIPQVKSVTDDGANTQLQVGDVIKSVNGTKIDFCTGNTFNILVNENIDSIVPIIVIRDGQEIETYLSIQTIEVDESVTITLGLGITTYKHTFFEALARCFGLTIAFLIKIFEFLGLLFTGQVALSGLTGPVTTVTTIASYAEQSISNLFIFLPFIAVNLAVFNLLPIPALDGSKIIFTSIEWIRGKPINRRIEGTIHFVGLILLLGLVVIVDLMHLFT